MLRLVRNAIIFLAMAVLTILAAWLFDLEALVSSLPSQWEYHLREALAVNISIASGVFVSSFVLAFLVQSKRPAWWVAAFGAFWAAVALFPSISWVTRPSGSSGLRLGFLFAWGPLMVAFASLLALRLASIVQQLRRPAHPNTEAST
jgi:hypothetical protein